MTIASGAVSTLHAQPAYCLDRSSRRAARAAVATVATAGNVGLYVYFKQVWWSGEKADHFRFNLDWDQEFRDQDKLGHFYGGYHLARIGREFLNTGCVGGERAAWLAAVYAFAFQFQIEMWDATQAKYGFSPGDLLFNTLGAGYALRQYYRPGLTALKPTISYNPTPAMRACARDKARCGELRGTLDYSGQTYWVSLDMDRLLPHELARAWPGILRVSLGHSITDWIVQEGAAGCPVGGGQCVRRAQRKFVLSLDLDPEKLPGNHPAWKKVKHELSYLHFPSPAIVFTPTTRFEPLYP